MLHFPIIGGAKLLSFSGTFLNKRIFLVAIKVSFRSLVPLFFPFDIIPIFN